MLTASLRLGITAALPALAALLAYLLPARLRLVIRLLGMCALAVCLGLLASEASLVAAGARLSSSYGTPVGGVHLLLRADPQGVIVAIAACAAGLLVLAQRGLRPLEVCGVLICTAGGVTAALGGNAVMLFAGFEAANAGTALLLLSGRGRGGRATVVALLAEHVAALGLLAAAVALQTATGTSDFSVLPAGAVGNGIALLWLGAAGFRLIGPALQPLRGPRAGLAAWAATGAVPVAGITILRLREAVSDHVPPTSGVVLACAGCAVAVVAAAVALQRRRQPVVVGRALCVLLAAPLITLSGVSGSAASTGVAAGLVALELAAAASAAWELPVRPRHRWVGAGALLAAGSLPLGFGTTALLLELGAVAEAGRPESLLLLPLGSAVLGGVVAASSAAQSVLRGPTAARRPAPLVALVAGVAGLAAALLPGMVGTTVVDPLGGGGVAFESGMAAVLSPGGGWAGGYFAAAGALLVTLALSAVALSGSRIELPSAAHLVSTRRPLLPWRPLRELRSAVAAAGPVLDGVDRWLALQPQLPLIVAASVAALLLIH